MGDAPRGRARRLASSATGFVVARPRNQKVGAVVAVALLVTAPFGGLRHEPPSAPAHVAVDKPITIGPYRFTFVKAVTVGDLGDAVPKPADGGRLFVIEAKVTNTNTRPELMVTLTDALIVTGAGLATSGGAVPRPTPVDVKDGTTLSAINPGSSYTVALVWEQSPGWSGTRATLHVEDVVFRHEDPLTLDPDAWWGTDSEAAHATLPVEARP